MLRQKGNFRYVHILTVKEIRIYFVVKCPTACKELCIEDWIILNFSSFGWYMGRPLSQKTFCSNLWKNFESKERNLQPRKTRRNHRQRVRQREFEYLGSAPSLWPAHLCYFQSSMHQHPGFAFCGQTVACIRQLNGREAWFSSYVHYHLSRLWELNLSLLLDLKNNCSL